MDIHKNILSFLSINELFDAAKLLAYPPEELFLWNKNNKSLWNFLSSSEIVRCIVYKIRRKYAKRLFVYKGNLFLISGELSENNFTFTIKTTKIHPLFNSQNTWTLKMINNFNIKIIHELPKEKEKNPFDSHHYYYLHNNMDGDNLQNLWECLINEIIKYQRGTNILYALSICRNTLYQITLYKEKYIFEDEFNTKPVDWKQFIS